MFFLDAFFKGLKPRFDDDSVDRLNYYYTPMILVIFSLTMSAKQYVGAWEQYSENYCFVQNTYFLPLHQEFPVDIGEREGREIGYYQWVPFILALQALLFYFPCFLWRLLNWQSGITVKGVVHMAQDIKNMEKDTRDKNVGIVAAHVFEGLEIQRELKSGNPLTGFLFYGKNYGSYVTGLYIVIKILYLLQVVLQFVILNIFLGTHYTFWGFEILRDLWYGREWQESGHFPRVTMCDFDVRVLGNLHKWTVQCVLMINMFNEKIYLFLWWWFMIVAIATLVSLVTWILKLSGSSQRNFVHRYLRVSLSLNAHDSSLDSVSERRAVNKFVSSFLRPDGVFLLRMISTNAGDLVTTDLVHELWIKFLETERTHAQPLPELISQGKSPSGSSRDEIDEKLPLRGNEE